MDIYISTSQLATNYTGIEYIKLLCNTHVMCHVLAMCGKTFRIYLLCYQGNTIDTTTQGQICDMPEDKSDINNTNMRPSSSNVTKSKCTEHNMYGIKILMFFNCCIRYIICNNRCYSWTTSHIILQCISVDRKRFG